MNVNYISYSPHFFLRLNPEMLVFGHEHLPERLHLTCSFDPRSEDANLHVTKENGNRKKPKVTVAVAEKSKLEKGAFVNPSELFNSLYEPLNLSNWKKRRRPHKRNHAQYVRLDNIEENHSANSLLKELKNLFWQHTRVARQSRLKIQESILPALEAWAESDLALDFFWENLRPVSKYLFTELETGFWISDVYTGPVVVLRGYVFKPREGISGEGFLHCFFDEQTVADLIGKFESAVSIVSASDHYSQTEHADTGIRIWE